jgi:DNA-binding response OmpR family regulator
MKLLLVSASREHANVLGYHLKPLGFELEQETDPVGAIERFERMQPQTILFDAVDFPRHWKPLLKLIRDKKPREEVVFLLVAGSDFPMEDAAKAAHLGVNGILGQNLSDKKELYRLEEIIRRYRSIRDKRNFTRLVPSSVEKVGLVFTHPVRLALVTGAVRELSIQGSSFLPSLAAAVADLPVGIEIPRCSLKIESSIISVNCKLTRNREELGFQFLGFDEGGHNALLRYIQTRSERALKNAVAEVGPTAS